MVSDDACDVRMAIRRRFFRIEKGKRITDKGVRLGLISNNQ